MRAILKRYNIAKLGNMLLTIAGSSIEYGFLLILNLILADVLSVEDFGVIRAATAYLMLLQMCGHFTLHDSIAAQVARAQAPAEQQAQIRSGLFLVVLASVVLVLIAEAALRGLPLVTGDLRWTLQWLILGVPFSCLYGVLRPILPAIGWYHALFFLSAATGVLQLVIILALVWVFALPGWVTSRLISTAASLVLAIGLCASLLRWGRITQDYCRMHLCFAVVQFPGAMMSMLFLNIDIIALERLGTDLASIGVYGFAALLVRSVGFLFNATGTAFFRDVANAWLNPPTLRRVLINFLAGMAGLGIVAGFAVLIAGHLLIAYGYGKTFGKAIPVLSVLCLSIPLNAVWTALSVINITGRKPHRSLAMSAAGLLSCAAAIIPLIEGLGPLGAAWAVVLGNLIAAMVGTAPIIAEIRQRSRN